MSNIGTAQSGKTLIGKGETSSPKFESLGTDSGLTDRGILIGQGDNAIQATSGLTDGQIVIGSSAGNPAAASLTQGPGISITPGSNSITIGLSGGGAGIDSFTPDSGTSPVVPDSNGLVTMAGSGSITTVGGTNSLTTQLTGLTAFNVLVGAGTSTITKVAPSATSGVPLISQGAASNPVFGTTVVAGGGTGATNLTGVLTGNGTSAVTANAVTQNGVLYGGASNAVSSLAVAATGTVMIGNTAAAPSFSATPAVTSITLSSGTALANYVQGTFSPTITGSTGAPSLVTYSTQVGTYTRIGNRVVVNIFVVLTARTGGTGNLLIQTLPFTSQSTTLNYSSGAVYTDKITLVADTGYVSTVTNNTTNILIISFTTGAFSSPVLIGAVPADGQFQLTVTYQV